MDEQTASTVIGARRANGATRSTLSVTGPAPCLIGGEWVVPDGGGRLPVHEPATGEVVAELAIGGAAEATAAADAAAAAFEGWAGRPARERGDILRRAADLLDVRRTTIGRLLAAETGKRLAEAEAEVHFSAEFFRWFAEAARHAAGEVLRAEQPGRHQVTFTRAAGVAACLTPWNFPVSIPARKIAPALAAGCPVVARVSERAPLAAVELFRALVDAGAPAGTVNLVHGPAAEVADAFLSHRAVRVVSFTGSTSVGRQIMVQAAERIVRPVLELGGNAPFIVFADADLDAAVAGLMVAKFRNNGQSCIAANRVYVERPVLGPFVERLAQAVGSMRVGDPLGPDEVDLGPLIDERRVAEVGQLVEEAVGDGGRLLTIPGALPHKGTWHRPCFVVEPDPSSALATTEVFGPAAGVFAFDDEDEVLQRANGTELGLAAYFYTRDVGRAWRVAERLEAGIIGCNDSVPPVVFGTLGGMKQSGIGREGGRLGLEEFEEWRYLSFGV
jgi:succinate-semialdehyde dehydrogenase / glutarate-semialdehyde dehydrogenase